MPDASNAFATVQPIQANVSDFINQQEQNAFAYRAEQRQIEAIEQDRKDKEQAKKDKLREKMLGQIPDNYDTGSSSLNEFQAKIIQKGVNRLGEIYKELANPSLSDDEKIKLEIEAQNIDRLPDNLKIATDVFSGKINDYKQGVAGGKYFRDPDFEKKLLSGFDNYVGGLDNGLPVVGFIDRNEDGKVDLADVVDYNQIQQGLGNWNFQKQFDLDVLAKTTGEKLGTSEVQTDKNFVKRITKSPDLKALDALADNLMINTDGTPKEVALSELRKRNLPVTPENLLEVKRIFKENVLAYTDKSDKTDVDYGAAETKKQNAIENARKRREEKAKELKITTTNVENTYFGNDSFGGKTLPKKGVLPNGLNLGNGVKFETIGGEKTGLDNSTVTNLFLNSEGKIIFTANVLDSKSSKEETTDYTGSSTTPPKYRSETRVATGATEARLASVLGYENADELKKYLQEINPENKVDNKPSASEYGL